MKIPLTEPYIAGNEIKYVNDCIRSTWISGGKYVKIFEEKFSKFCKTKYATSVTSGTAALHVALYALSLGTKDEVIIPDLTYVASSNAVTYTGAKPVFVDVNKETGTIDPEKIEEKISKRTKAIIAVHLYGHPCDMDIINEIARQHKLIVIEDACEAHGALYKSRPTGSLSRAGCFSFFGNKTITTGEGGMIVSNDKKLIEKINYLKFHSMTKKNYYYHDSIGFNYRLTNLQSAFGLAQLEKVQEVLKKKRKNAEIYNLLLKDIDEVRLPVEKNWAKSSYWLYSIVLRKKGLRNKLIKALRKKNIDTRPFFIPMHALPMFRQKGDFRNSSFLSENGMNLPSSPLLEENQIEFICEQIKKIIKND
ncbi:MAG: hypothetical protein A2W22_04135 [Candidatus Levybacteria bacterium RBG_16_35_11]|nr:MAG: hypothetical protein A2W22_04135 [Candidatus Levybacteria bacterium RBG_16_35_11]